MKENVIAEAQKIEDEQIKVNDEICFENAKKNGFTQKEAENCEENNMLCKNCPFLYEEQNAEAQIDGLEKI